MPIAPARPAGLRVSLLLLFLAGAPPLLLAQAPPPVCTPQVPCADPRGCPDLTIDPGVLDSVTQVDHHTFAPTDCAVVEGMAVAGDRKLIIFSTQSNNNGPGALTLGHPADHPDWFEFAACHGHYHIKDYADYRLWTPAGYAQWKALRAANPGLCAREVLDANPGLASQFIRGNKLGICFYDVVFMGQARGASEVCPSTLDPQTYLSCDDAGLGVCWADIYEAGLYGFVDGQWIDVTGVPNGDYVLENESNATHLITETDYTNNSTAIRIRLRRQNLKVLGPA
jgi:hypothetical protein